MNMMQQFYKIAIIAAAFLLVMSIVGFVAQSSSSTYWYVDGVKDTWFMQEDVYAFRTNDLAEFRGGFSDAIVEQVVFRKNYPDKLHLVYFKSGTSDWDRQNTINQIKDDAQFSRDFPVITRFNTATYQDGLWYVSDDQLLVTFRGGAPGESALKTWTGKHGLVTMHNPSNLPEGGNYSYIFKWDAQDADIQNGILLARQIYLQDSSVLLNVEPNLIKAYDEYAEPVTPAPISTSVASIDGESTTDKFYVVNEHNTELQVFFNINSTKNNLQFSIFDLQGRQHHFRPIDWQETQLRADIANLPAGVYFSCILNEGGQIMVSQRFRKI